jgi:hypothetical protein
MEYHGMRLLIRIPQLIFASNRGWAVSVVCQYYCAPTIDAEGSFQPLPIFEEYRNGHIGNH